MANFVTIQFHFESRKIIKSTLTLSDLIRRKGMGIDTSCMNNFQCLIFNCKSQDYIKCLTNYFESLKIQPDRDREISKHNRILLYFQPVKLVKYELERDNEKEGGKRECERER